jgi:hypothetical protein
VNISSAVCTTENTDYPILQESEIVEQIDRDVKRTHPEMQFFNGNSSLSNQVGVFSDMGSLFCYQYIVQFS